jgi:hypothetical protein
LADQQSKLTEKLKNSVLNMFLVVNEPEKQKFSLKKIKISGDSGIWLALAWDLVKNRHFNSIFDQEKVKILIQNILHFYVFLHFATFF